MPTYKVTGPDGLTAEVNAPEGATEQQAIDYAKKNWLKITNRAPDMSTKYPIEMNFLEKGLAPIGQGMHSVGQGISQRIGDALSTTDWGKNLSGKLGLPTAEDVAETRRIDKRLLDKRGSGIGSMYGKAVPFIAAAPESLLGSAAVGAGMGAVEPTAPGESVVGNTAKGSLGGMFGNVGGRVIGAGINKVSPYVSKLFGKEAPQIPLTEKQEALQAAMDKGYTLSPAETNPSVLNRAMEGLAGKAPTSQLAMAKNEVNTTRLVKEELGIPADQPLNVNALKNIREKAGQAYAELKGVKQPMKADAEFQTLVGNLDDSATTINQSFPGMVNESKIRALQESLSSPEMTFNASVEAVKRLRREASANLRGYDDPDKLALGRAQLQAANGIEDLMDRNLKDLQMPDLLEAYRNARMTIAKTHDVQEVLGENGLVSAKLLLKRMENDVPLSGNLADIARAQATQPRSLRNVGATGGATLSDPLSTMIGLSSGNPASAVGIPFIRHGAQQAILSPWYQRNLVRPQAGYANTFNGYLPELMGIGAPQVALQGQQ